MRLSLRLSRLLLAVFFALATSLAAQTPATGALRGVVVNDATGNFVQGARLALVGTMRTAVTD
eukprot:gene9882-13320_t